MGLLSDGLDMLADSFVYAISLFAVGGTLARKKTIARTAAYFQMILALIGFSEVIRRVFSNQPLPHFKTMILISFFALIANSFCLWIMHKSKNKQEAHMRASMIFTSNDVIINLGVMLTGVLVHLLQSGAPDLIIGSIVFALVLNGARRMLRV